MDNLIATTVRKALDELKLNYHEDESVFEFNIRVEHTNAAVKVVCAEDQEILIAVAFSGVFAPEEKIDAVCRWICNKNIKCNIGNYTIDTEDGEVSFRVSCPVDGGAVNSEIAKVAILNAIKTIDDDYLELLKLLYFDNESTEIPGAKTETELS